MSSDPQRPESRPDQIWVMKHLEEVLAGLRELARLRERVRELEAEQAGRIGDARTGRGED